MLTKGLKNFIKLLIVLFLLVNIVVFCHAYKFTHYYTVGEVNIIPQSKKTGWDKTKELVFGFNAVKQQNIAPDSAFKTIYLFTKDSLRLEAWYKTVPNAKGTVALFHGHGGKKSSNLEEAAAFNSFGYNTLLTDFRAHGSSQGNTCTIGYYEAEDVYLAYTYLQQNGEKNIVLWGISLGAATITKAIHDYDIKPNKLILEMPFASLPNAVEGRLKIMGLPPQPLGSLLTFWGGVQHGFWAFNMQPQLYVKTISCPILLQRGKNDPRVTYTETENIYNNISSPKKWVEYDNSAHESLCVKEKNKWYTTVASFLQ